MTISRTTEEYQRFLNDTSWYTHTNEHNAPELMYLTLGLAGESGEFADAVKKIIRVSGTNDDESFKALLLEKGGEEKLLEELGDVLWYLTKLADFLGTSTEDLMVENTYKLYNRLNDRNQFPEGTLKWPFTNPFLTYDKVKEKLDVCVDEKV